MGVMEITWPMLNLQPINLFNLPAHLKAGCKHTHWMYLPSFHQKWCYDCDETRDIDTDKKVYRKLRSNLFALTPPPLTC